MTAPVILCMGAKDGAGTTTIAVIAAIAQQRRGLRTCLADCDAAHHGDVAAAFSGGPACPSGTTRTIREIAANHHRLTPETLRGYCQIHPGGLGAVTRGDDATGEATYAVLTALRAAVDLVVIDAGSRCDPVVAAAFAAATHCVCVARPDGAVIEAARRMMARWQQALIPRDRVTLLYNAWGGEGPLTPALVAERLRTEPAAVGRADPALLAAAWHQGIPLAASEPRHPFVLQVSQVIDRLLATAPDDQGPIVDIERLCPGTSLAGCRRDPPDGAPVATELRRELVDALQKEIDRQGIARQGAMGDPRALRAAIEPIVIALIDQLPSHRLAGVDRASLLAAVLDEAVGYGPLEPLLQDPAVTEVMVNGPRQVWIERAGTIEPTTITFAAATDVARVIERIVAPTGRRIDESMPMVDARLPDGSRVHAIIPPLSLTGPVITIRRFPAQRLTMADLLARGSVTPAMASLLAELVRARRNVVVSGGTGTGKTTLLNILSGSIPSAERIITIEDAAELQLAQPHVVRLEARPPNVEGTGAVTIRDLVRNALRMRPDRIVVGECRGGEALDMLQAMNTGHDGSLTTIHANSPRDAVARLETLVMFAGMALPSRAIREQIAGAIHAIVQLARRADGTRGVVAIARVIGMAGEEVMLENSEA